MSNIQALFAKLSIDTYNKDNSEPINDKDKSITLKSSSEEANNYAKRLVDFKSFQFEDLETGKKCRSCGKLTAVVVQEQLRSGDEGMSEVLVCSSCKFRQRLN